MRVPTSVKPLSPYAQIGDNRHTHIHTHTVVESPRKLLPRDGRGGNIRFAVCVNGVLSLPAALNTLKTSVVFTGGPENRTRAGHHYGP